MTTTFESSKMAVNRAGELVRWFIYETKDEPVSSEVLEAWGLMESWRSFHASPLSAVATSIRRYVIQEDCLVDNRVDVTQRLKKRPTIYNKLNRYPNMKLSQMQDIGGVRAVLPDLDCVARVSRRLRKNRPIRDHYDYIAHPKESGYRALHHVVLSGGRMIEVQLRTARQDAWANEVEEETRQSGTGYKFGRGQGAVQEYFRVMSDAFAVMDRGEVIGEELQAAINEAYVRAKPLRRAG